MKPHWTLGKDRAGFRDHKPRRKMELCVHTVNRKTLLRLSADNREGWGGKLPQRNTSKRPDGKKGRLSQDSIGAWVIGSQAQLIHKF